jgi:hypothetical protein
MPKNGLKKCLFDLPMLTYINDKNDNNENSNQRNWSVKKGRNSPGQCYISNAEINKIQLNQKDLFGIFLYEDEKIVSCDDV